MERNGQDDKQRYYDDYVKRIGGETIPAYQPELGEDELNNVIDVIKSNWISEGKYVREFETRLASMCGRSHALAFANGTAALISGMRSLGIGAGDDVIVPSLSHSADPNSISVIGANPVFADVDENTLCLSPQSIAAAITPKTRAVLYVSAYGNAGDLDGIAAYAKQNGIVFINDCAPALFGQFRGRPIASYGDFAMLSFFADKTITTGEGGMLLTDDADLISEANIFKHDGRRERGFDVIERVGYNFRITEMQAALGVAQLKKKDRFVKRKKEIHDLFRELLKNASTVRLFALHSEGDIGPHRNIIFTSSAQKMIDYLVGRGIGARTLFMPMHSQPCYQRDTQFPVTDKLFQTGVCLPSAPSLTDDQVGYIARCVKDFDE